MSCSADLVIAFDNVRCYYGPQLQQLSSGTLQVLSMPLSNDSSHTMFIQILPSSEKFTTITIPLIPGHTLIDQQQNARHQFSITNPSYDNQLEKYWIELSPATEMDLVYSLGDILMQTVAFQQSRVTTSLKQQSDAFTGTTYQGPLRQEIPPQKLALVTPTGEVLGVIASEPFIEEPIPPTTATSTPVIVDTQTNNVSLIDSAGSLTVKTASYIGAGIVFGTALLGAGIKAGSDLLVKNTSPAIKPAEVSPSTQTSAEKVYYYSEKAVQVSHATVNKVTSYADTFGRKLTSGLEKSAKNGNKTHSTTLKLIRNVATAVDIIGNSLDQGLKTLTADSKQATSQFVKHRYGGQAQTLAETSMGVIENATLVYIDARGISRRAIIKAVGKGAVKYHLEDGREITMESMDDGSMVITNVTPAPAPNSTL